MQVHPLFAGNREVAAAGEKRSADDRSSDAAAAAYFPRMQLLRDPSLRAVSEGKTSCRAQRPPLHLLHSDGSDGALPQHQRLGVGPVNSCRGHSDGSIGSRSRSWHCCSMAQLLSVRDHLARCHGHVVAERWAHRAFSAAPMQQPYKSFTNSQHLRRSAYCCSNAAFGGGMTDERTRLLLLRCVSERWWPF